MPFLQSSVCLSTTSQTLFTHRVPCSLLFSPPSLTMTFFNSVLFFTLLYFYKKNLQSFRFLIISLMIGKLNFGSYNPSTNCDAAFCSPIFRTLSKMSANPAISLLNFGTSTSLTCLTVICMYTARLGPALSRIITVPGLIYNANTCGHHPCSEMRWWSDSRCRHSYFVKIG